MEAIQYNDSYSEDMRALMPKDGIVSQLVHMLSSEKSQVHERGASTLSKFAKYSKHGLAGKSFGISDSFLEDMRALMPKHVILPKLVNMLSGEDCDVQSVGAFTLLDFAQYGEHKLA